jgi:hypothetical protein
MEFPNLVYRSPGSCQCKGGTYQWLPVNNDDELSKAIEEGYYPTPELALEDSDEFSWLEYAISQGWAKDSNPGKDKLPSNTEKPKQETEVTAAIPADREVLKVMAQDLGIVFKNNIPTARLAKLVKEALE